MKPIPRKWAEEIKAWADGYDIESKRINSRVVLSVNSPWVIDPSPTFDDPDYEFRIYNRHRELMDKWEASGGTLKIEWRWNNSEWKNLIGNAPLWDQTADYRDPTQELKRIDWYKMPEDILCQTEDYGLLYFSGKLSIPDKSPLFFKHGATSTTNMNDTLLYSDYPVKIIENDWQVWFGGECPVPEGVSGEILLRDGTKIKVRDLAQCVWTFDNPISAIDIIAYRILGVAEGWME